MEFKLYTGKSLSDAITNASMDLGITSDRLEYEVVDKGSAGVFGIGSRPAKINAREKAAEETKSDISVNKEEKANMPAKEKKQNNISEAEIVDICKEFLSKVFAAMDLEVNIKVSVDEEEVNIDLEGDEMGVLIGKRGQTLDSLQYLLSLVVNKNSVNYLRVKLDTENYRERRKKTLENLARNIAFKVKRTKRPVSLEPMNPYERRVIHSALQDDKYVITKSEGEEPFRHVVVMLKK